MPSTVINPIRFANQVNDQFLNYQLTAFPITDHDLAQQARSLFRGPLGKSPLIQGPYISLERSFKPGRDLNALAEAGVIHRVLPGLAEHPTLFTHQDEALQAVQAGRHCLIATGTGSGKTEAFLYPILDHCLHLRDQEAPEGVVAIIVYPMNALAIDQLNRLRAMLVGSGISFGMYIGSTPSTEGEIENTVRMKPDEDREEYHRYVNKYKAHVETVISPPEERLTEQEMAQHPPRLLLTNVKQLELLLTRGKDIGIFIDAPLKFLIFDEAHTYTGAEGAEVACLTRRLKAFCGKSPDEVICVGTSATLAGPESDEESAAQFAHRFFGIDPGMVSLVREQYVAEEFPPDRYIPQVPDTDTVELLERTLQSLEVNDERAIRDVVKELTGLNLSTKTAWPEALYEHFKSNEYIFTVFHHLGQPNYLPEAAQRIALQLGRPIDMVEDQAKGELLCYLALGAAAEKEGNPLLRPKVHYFVRGLEGAVVVFTENGQPDEFRANLYLSIENALDINPVEVTACPPVLVCKNCGQHYFEGFYGNLEAEDGNSQGGCAEGDNIYWEPADEAEGGKRLVFTNRFISEVDDEEGSATERLERKRFQLYFCRHCGTIHKYQGTCQNPKCKRTGKLVPIWGIVVGERLLTCPSCGQRGRSIGSRIIEPIKPLRATTVADVHILAQNMVNAIQGPQQKLVVFSDNRQDAAFQAGWMQDHARRYRLRHLIYDYIRDSSQPNSIGDIQDHILRVFKKDRTLAMSLAPEVYAGRSDEAFGRGLEDLLRYYIRIALIQEFATAFKQRDSLETWGMVRVVYSGIGPDEPFVKEWADKLGISAEELAESISALVDCYRRTRYFHDEHAPIFSRYWREGDAEVQHGFLPFFDFPPKGLKERREGSDKDTYVTQFRSARGQTLSENFVSKWGISDDQLDGFMTSLWRFLTDTTGIIEPVVLRGSKGKSLPGSAGTCQVASSKIGILAQRGRYRCNICQRVHTRDTLGTSCSAMHCKGKLVYEEPPVDDYNIALLAMPFSMVTAKEHSAQVPAKIRETIEREFKKPNGQINCLVSTPTLELGVDIGALDMVLMRNVPPKPSNYWQRAGRAGRRYRMAVIYTYCRRSSHDGYFFRDPDQILSGNIITPRFNLRNEVMIRKHIHACVLSEIIRLANQEPANTGLTEDAIEELVEVWHTIFPNYIDAYLFEDGRQYRQEPFRCTALNDIITKYLDYFFQVVKQVFSTHWPEGDQHAVSDVLLGQFITEMPASLQEVLNRLYHRMVWAINTQRKLIEQERRGLLDEYENRLKNRCVRYLQQLADHQMRTYTLTVLATEGFLPGYGVIQGSVTAFASHSFSAIERRPDFELPRPPSIAIREFIPGNMIYANAGRFRTTLFHFPIGANQVDPEEYLVDLEQERVTEAKKLDRQNGQYGGENIQTISGLPICDTDISFASRITDEEQNRFQLPVNIMGYLKRGHRGGAAYTVSGTEIQLRFGQQLRLINVGAADRVRAGELGYPVCTVCGAVRSPYASQAELDHFRDIHVERCGRAPWNIAFSSDTAVDGFLFQGLESKGDAMNLGESLRGGAARILEMDDEDLQLLALPQPDGSFHLFLYDPMPGGSGLLSQIIEHWLEVIDAARQNLANCSGGCEKSCYNCLRTYRNIYFHPLLDRHRAVDLLNMLHDDPVEEREIPPVEEIGTPFVGTPTNKGEFELGQMLIRAGFPTFKNQHSISIGSPYHSTTPDLYYEDSANALQLAVYLDGLSRGIHGKAERAQMDRVIRQQLEADGVDVIEIARSDLDDPEAMQLHLKRIAAKLRSTELKNKVELDTSWFDDDQT